MQSFKKKIDSAKGKAITLSKNGLNSFYEGKHNFENTNLDIELLAEERKATCVSCEFYEDEPIIYLQVIDTNIPELSKKMCGDCYCILSYKLRQSKEKCIKWRE